MTVEVRVSFLMVAVIAICLIVAMVALFRRADEAEQRLHNLETLVLGLLPDDIPDADTTAADPPTQPIDIAPDTVPDGMPLAVQNALIERSFQGTTFRFREES